MASMSLIVDDLMKCPICFEGNKQLRKLPTCKHSFCENCMRNHFSTTKSDRETDPDSGGEPNFLCPVCRCSNQCPRDMNDFDDWIKTLTLDGEVVDATSETMCLCFPCSKLEKSCRAVKRCVECQENYCEVCFNLFHSLNVLKDHTFFEMKSEQSDADPVYQKLNDYIVCPAHPSCTVNWICEDDDELCCQKCAFVKHRNCKSVKELGSRGTRDDIDKDTKKLSESIKGLTSYGQSVIETIKRNKTEYKTAAEFVSQSIRETRAKMNLVFDALEEKSTQTCRTLVKKFSLSDDMKIQTIQGLVDRLIECCSLLEKVKQYDSNPLIDAIAHKLKEEFNAHETSLLEIISDIRKPGFELQTERFFKEFAKLNVNATDKLAVVNENEGDLFLPKYNRRQLLKFSIIKIKGTHTILAKASKDIYSQYRCMISLPKNQMMLVDERLGLCCLTNDRYRPIASCHFLKYKTKENEKDVSKKPFSATHLKDNIVLVSVPDRKEIYFLCFGATLAIVGTVNTLHTPKALQSLSSGDIAVSWNDPVAFGIFSTDCYCLQEKTYFTQDQAGRVLKSFDYMALDEKRSHVIQPCTTDKAVYCFDFKGSPKFTYTHKSLTNPKGVALDSDGNIYVCDQAENCIHILTGTGIPVRLFREGCPEQPLAITFDESGTTFFVSQIGISGYYYTDKCLKVIRYSLC